MKYPSKNWPTFSVQFWTHQHDMPGKPLNDCFGNSLHRNIKARTEAEAKKLATSRHGARRFGKVVRLATAEPLPVPANVERTPATHGMPPITPGPWGVYGDDASDVRPATHKTGNNGVVANCPGYSTQRRANAKAIAAVPDLLAAFASLLPRLRQLDTSATHDGLANCEALAKVKAALTKAGYKF